MPWMIHKRGHGYLTGIFQDMNAAQAACDSLNEKSNKAIERYLKKNPKDRDAMKFNEYKVVYCDEGGKVL